MAYDPNDPADKKIVDDAVNAALETAREEHEAEVTRLTEKNTELLGKLKKAREGKEDAGEVARLESELSDAQSDLRSAQSSLRTAERDLKREKERAEKAENERDTERNLSQNELIENKLTAALVENKVAPHFMDAAKALLKGKAAVEVDADGNRTVKADGKDVADFVKEWSAGDAGKHYIIAPGNAGGGAAGPNGGGNPTGAKKLEDLTEAERLDMSRNRPEEWKQVLAAAGQTNNADAPLVIQ
jgi:hypothetical protein